MKLLRLTETEIIKIYREELVFDFPAAEVKPLERILQMLHDGIYFCYGLYEEDALCGYAFFVEGKSTKAALLDYYAVVRGQRSSGIGSRFLALLREELRDYDMLILESEAIDASKNEEETEIRTRRIAFYLRNGLRQTGIRSILFGVEYEILCTDLAKQVTEPELRRAIEEIYRQMFYPKFADRVEIL